MAAKSEEAKKRKKDYDIQYQKQNIKRIPLDVPKDFYERLKAVVDLKGMKVNAFIKQAIEEKLQREPVKIIEEPTREPFEDSP